MDKKKLHHFKVKDLTGKEVDLADYKGKVVMVVNTATECGFTPQLGDLEQLYKEYREKGFEILGFPSNDFAGQEPRDGDAIGQFCQKNYGVSFPMFDKMHVKGKETSDLFQFLSDKKLNGKVSSTPRWNFHKYLVDKDGQVTDYFYTFTKPTAGRVKKAIEKLLKK